MLQNAIVDYEQFVEEFGEEVIQQLLDTCQAGTFRSRSNQKTLFFPIKNDALAVPTDEQLEAIEQRYNRVCIELAQRVVSMADMQKKDVQDLAAELGLDFELVFELSESGS